MLMLTTCEGFMLEEEATPLEEEVSENDNIEGEDEQSDEGEENEEQDEKVFVEEEEVEEEEAVAPNLITERDINCPYK